MLTEHTTSQFQARPFSLRFCTSFIHQTWTECTVTLKCFKMSLGIQSFPQTTLSLPKLNTINGGIKPNHDSGRNTDSSSNHSSQLAKQQSGSKLADNKSTSYIFLLLRHRPNSFLENPLRKKKGTKIPVPILLLHLHFIILKIK